MEIKGIIHCHSTYSYDAKLSLSSIRQLCIAHNIQFVCMTEHTDELTKEKASAFIEECTRLSDATFRFIPGFEVPYEHTHILLIGARSFQSTHAADIDSLRAWTRETPFVVLAHPVRNHFIVADDLLHELDALEVWNQQYEGKRVPRTRSLALFELLRKKKSELIAVGGIDLHRIEHFGAPVVTLDIEALDETRIIEKLRTGAFVISSDHARVYGSLPNPRQIIDMYRFESAFSVGIISIGKRLNAALALFNLKFPKSIKELIRRKV